MYNASPTYTSPQQLYQSPTYSTNNLRLTPKQQILELAQARVDLLEREQEQFEQEQEQQEQEQWQEQQQEQGREHSYGESVQLAAKQQLLELAQARVQV